MKHISAKITNVAAIGKMLVDHSKRQDVTAKRGLVVELFPFIYEASTRMSARAISRFLWEKQGIKLSAVTITKAVANPKKYWNLYFDVIEPFAKTFEKGSYDSPMSAFLFDDELFEKMTRKLPIRAYQGRWLDLKALGQITFADVAAGNVLRDKWVSIDLETRLKARPYIEHRLGGKGDQGQVK